MFLSIILPLYKVENYIEACLQSLLLQTDRDFELILVNDGSPDASEELAGKLLQDYELPYTLLHTENRGVSAARNTGLKESHGDYAVFVDSDDTVTPDFVADFHRLARENPENAVFFCDFAVVAQAGAALPEKQQWQVKIFSAEEAQLAQLHRTVKFLLPAMLLRRSFLCENGLLFDEAVHYSEDVQFIWRILAYNTAPVLFLEKASYIYNFHGNSTMSASGLQKILTGCAGLKRLEQELPGRLCPPCAVSFAGIWTFSMLHGAAKLLSYKDFKVLYARCEGRSYLRLARKGGGRRVRLLSFLAIHSPFLAYSIFRSC